MKNIRKYENCEHKSKLWEIVRTTIGKMQKRKYGKHKKVKQKKRNYL